MTTGAVVEVGATAVGVPTMGVATTGATRVGLAVVRVTLGARTDVAGAAAAPVAMGARMRPAIAGVTTGAAAGGTATGTSAAGASAAGVAIGAAGADMTAGATMVWMVAEVLIGVGTARVETASLKAIGAVVTVGDKPREPAGVVTASNGMAFGTSSLSERTVSSGVWVAVGAVEMLIRAWMIAVVRPGVSLRVLKLSSMATAG